MLETGAQPAAPVTPEPGSGPEPQPDVTASGRSAAADQQVAILLADSHWSEVPLLKLSSELLAIYASLPLYTGHQQVPELRQYLVQHLSRFRQQGVLADYSPKMMDKACYLLAAALDEGILATEWGRLSGWENHSLLSQLFQQRNGGEVFFVLLQQTQQRPDNNTDLLMLSYLMLRLGFQGRYRHSDGHELAELSQALYEQISHIRGQQVPMPPQLPQPQAWRPLRILRFSRYLLLTLSVGAIGYGMTWAWTHQLEQPNAPALERTLNFIAPPPPLKKGTVYISTPDEMNAKGEP